MPLPNVAAKAFLMPNMWASNTESYNFVGEIVSSGQSVFWFLRP